MDDRIVTPEKLRGWAKTFKKEIRKGKFFLFSTCFMQWTLLICWPLIFITKTLNFIRGYQNGFTREDIFFDIITNIGILAAFVLAVKYWLKTRKHKKIILRSMARLKVHRKLILREADKIEQLLQDVGQ